MGKRVRHAKWAAIPLVLMAVFAAVPAVYGGLRWSGVDPVLNVDGHQVNITIAVPPGQWCAIGGPIAVEVSVEDVDDATVVSESYDPDGSKCGAYTTTTVVGGGQDSGVGVSVLVNSAGPRFPVDVSVAVDGTDAMDCSGRANDIVKCALVSLGE